MLSDEEIADNVIGVLFAAQDTTASVLTWILKYLHDDPKLLEAIKMEQMSIYQANEGGKMPLTWNQTRNMPITHRTLQSCELSSVGGDIAFNMQDRSSNSGHPTHLSYDWNF
ncbi:abscisic acid 8 -hydroxylase 4-like protein [Trifolium pratense]|uniref:Abscisic acid 8-hydroxylase 4-like protein n=1 Tax=Trifolium pratense TaxID=57577 RepID=A0A2K3K0Z5_TRIPR|nr:abscisic acid 8 -hydroxylase 4-like protein [Trifolium pratense]